MNTPTYNTKDNTERENQNRAIDTDTSGLGENEPELDDDSIETIG